MGNVSIGTCPRCSLEQPLRNGICYACSGEVHKPGESAPNPASGAHAERRAQAKAILRSALGRSNPSDAQDPEGDEAGASLGDAILAMKARGIRVEDLSEDDWVSELKASGFSDDQINVALEDIAAWGVDDAWP